jgi:hypothetical protein
MDSSLSPLMVSPSLLGLNWLLPPGLGRLGPSPLPENRFREALDPGNCPFFCWVHQGF